jgi:Domain of unknown function (DUF4173)
LPLTDSASGAATSEVHCAPWLLWGCALALAAAGTELLFAARPGVNWPLLVVAVSVALTAMRAARVGSPRPGVYPSLALACFISLGAAFTADATYEVLIAAATLFALAAALMSHSCAAPGPGAGTPSVLAAPYAAVLVACEAGRRTALAKQALRAGRGLAAVRGFALAIPITLALALLLSQADPTLDHARETIIEAFRDLSVVPRSIVFCVLAVCLIGAFGIASQPAPRLHEQDSAVQGASPLLGDTERLIVTGSIASLFTLFLALQVAYLFGDPGGRSGSGVSYADAVHRGFAELNVAASVCGIVLFALRRFASPPRRPRLLRGLEWIVVLEAQVLLASAFYRVDLYEGAYGFTRLRLFVQVYAAVAFIALCLLVLELTTRPVLDRLLRRVLAVAAVAFGTLILANSDSWIARQNLERYHRTGQLDVSYLTQGLGPDAVALLVGALPRLPAPMAGHLANCLRARYPATERYPTQWFEWNLRRAALNRALATLGPGTPGAPQDGCTGS